MGKLDIVGKESGREAWWEKGFLKVKRELETVGMVEVNNAIYNKKIGFIKI